MPGCSVGTLCGNRTRTGIVLTAPVSLALPCSSLCLSLTHPVSVHAEAASLHGTGHSAPFHSAKCRFYRLSRQFFLRPKGWREQIWLVKVQLVNCVPMQTALLLFAWCVAMGWARSCSLLHWCGAVPVWKSSCACSSEWGVDQGDEFNNQRVIKLQPIFLSFPHACPFLYLQHLWEQRAAKFG